MNKHQKNIAGWKTKQSDAFIELFEGPILEVPFNSALELPKETVTPIAEFLTVPVTDKALRIIRPSCSRFST